MADFKGYAAMVTVDDSKNVTLKFTPNLKDQTLYEDGDTVTFGPYTATCKISETHIMTFENVTGDDSEYIGSMTANKGDRYFTFTKGKSATLVTATTTFEVTKLTVSGNASTWPTTGTIKISSSSNTYYIPYNSTRENNGNVELDIEPSFIDILGVGTVVTYVRRAIVSDTVEINSEVYTVKNTFRKGTKFYHNGTINAGDTVTSIRVETVDDNPDLTSWPRTGIVRVNKDFEYEDFEFVARRKNVLTIKPGTKARKTHDDVMVWVSEVHLLQHEFDPPIEEDLTNEPITNIWCVEPENCIADALFTSKAQLPKARIQSFTETVTNVGTVQNKNNFVNGKVPIFANVPDGSTIRISINSNNYDFTYHKNHVTGAINNYVSPKPSPDLLNTDLGNTTIIKSVKTNEITCIGLTYALFPTSGTLKIGDEETKVSYTERTVQSNENTNENTVTFTLSNSISVKEGDVVVLADFNVGDNTRWDVATTYGGRHEVKLTGTKTKDNTINETLSVTNDTDTGDSSKLPGSNDDKLRKWPKRGRFRINHHDAGMGINLYAEDFEYLGIKYDGNATGFTSVLSLGSPHYKFEERDMHETDFYDRRRGTSGTFKETHHAEKINGLDFGWQSEVVSLTKRGGGPLMWAFYQPTSEIALKHDAKAFEKVLERDGQHGIVSVNSHRLIDIATLVARETAKGSNGIQPETELAHAWDPRNDNQEFFSYSGVKGNRLTGVRRGRNFKNGYTANKTDMLNRKHFIGMSGHTHEVINTWKSELELIGSVNSKIPFHEQSVVFQYWRPGRGEARIVRTVHSAKQTLMVKPTSDVTRIKTGDVIEYRDPDLDAFQPVVVTDVINDQIVKFQLPSKSTIDEDNAVSYRGLDLRVDVTQSDKNATAIRWLHLPFCNFESDKVHVSTSDDLTFDTTFEEKNVQFNSATLLRDINGNLEDAEIPDYAAVKPRLGKTTGFSDAYNWTLGDILLGDGEERTGDDISDDSYIDKMYKVRDTALEPIVNTTDSTNFTILENKVSTTTTFTGFPGRGSIKLTYDGSDDTIIDYTTEKRKLAGRISDDGTKWVWYDERDTSDGGDELASSTISIEKGRTYIFDNPQRWNIEEDVVTTYYTLRKNHIVHFSDRRLVMENFGSNFFRVHTNQVGIRLTNTSMAQCESVDTTVPNDRIVQYVTVDDQNIVFPHLFQKNDYVVAKDRNGHLKNGRILRVNKKTVDVQFHDKTVRKNIPHGNNSQVWYMPNLSKDTRNIPYKKTAIKRDSGPDQGNLYKNKLNVVTGAFGIQSNNGYKFDPSADIDQPFMHILINSLVQVKRSARLKFDT